MSERIIFENEIKSLMESAGELFDAIDHDHEEVIDPRSEYQHIFHTLEGVKDRFPSVPGCNYYPRCKTCGFWKKYEKEEIPQGFCECPKIFYMDENIEVTDEVIYGDSDHYSAFLLMGADFGCVHHREKK
jgi:hypothetical protein